MGFFARKKNLNFLGPNLFFFQFNCLYFLRLKKVVVFEAGGWGNLGFNFFFPWKKRGFFFSINNKQSCKVGTGGL